VPDRAPGHPEIERIVAPNPGPMTLEGTNTFVVERGRRAYVIDPGPDDPAHLGRVRAAGEARGRIAGVLLTHGHGDHAAGASGLGLPILWPPQVDHENAEPRAAEAGPFGVIATPGHSSDHVVFTLGRVCFCGDLVLGEGSSFVPPDGGSLAAYLDSLRRLRELEPELLCPGHGPWITGPRAKVDEYLEHRLERERKLLAALEAGERSRARLLDAAWDDVPAQMRGAAEVVMEAHLAKLESEGRLPRDLRD
jgi:glyoxylase-like metal-dependent hydrolase (beta-lactamase superfamily II)